MQQFDFIGAWFFTGSITHCNPKTHKEINGNYYNVIAIYNNIYLYKMFQ